MGITGERPQEHVPSGEGLTDIAKSWGMRAVYQRNFLVSGKMPGISVTTCFSSCSNLFMTLAEACFAFSRFANLRIWLKAELPSVVVVIASLICFEKRKKTVLQCRRLDKHPTRLRLSFVLIYICCSMDTLFTPFLIAC